MIMPADFSSLLCKLDVQQPIAEFLMDPEKNPDRTRDAHIPCAFGQRRAAGALHWRSRHKTLHEAMHRAAIALFIHAHNLSILS